MTVEAYLASEDAGPAVLASRRPVLSALAAFLRERRLRSWEDVGDATLGEFLEEYTANLEPAPAKRVRTAVRRLLRFAIATGARSPGSFPVLSVGYGLGARRGSVEGWGQLRPGPPGKAFLDWCHHLRRVQPNTLATYSTTLSQFVALLEDRGRGVWCEVKRSDVMEFIKSLDKRRLSIATVTNRLAAVRGLMGYLATHGFRPNDGVQSLKLGKAPTRRIRVLTQEEAGRLIETPRGEQALSIRDRAILELAYGSGLRAAELCSLTLSDLNLTDRTLLVFGKGAKERIGIFGGKALDALRVYLERGRPALVMGVRRPHSILFVNDRGGPLSRMGLWRIVRTACVRARIEGRVSPHTLRHSFATHLLLAGAGLEVISKLLGHESMATTMLYTHLDTRHLKEAIEEHHPRK